MYRARRRFHTDNAVDDFLTDINTNFGLTRKDLSEAELGALSKGLGRFVRGDETYRIFHPTGPRYFRANAVDDEAYNVFREYVQDATKIDIEDLPQTRELLAVGSRKEFILPEAIANRLDQFYLPDPLRKGPLSLFRRATSWWKRNTIWWGLSRFAVFQLLGDGVNLLRSNPRAFAHLNRAMKEQFAHYGTPRMSSTQAIAALAGGTLGYGLDEALGEGDSTIGSILAGAGLGYLLGTRRVAGRLRPFSQLYDEADELGAINSGFHYQEEEIHRRILGAKANALPTRRERPWLRGLDTVSTILSGKVHGDPYPWGRVPAEMIEHIQVERENLMRFASYIQQTESGVHPRIAARNARESLVDYGKFTDFENRVLRGFLLPFYSFYRHNIPNWIKAAVGREGGRAATVGIAATAAIAAGDIIAQAWNETFFPDVERGLDDFRRERFHIILGDPRTGESYSDVNGAPMVLGWEMPYEQALEFFGLARPGYVFSQLFGIAGEFETTDFSERARMTAKDFATLKPVRDFTLNLLTPVLKEPLQIGMNRDLFMDAPIVPQALVGTTEGRNRMLTHVAKTFFRQIREVQRTAGEVSGKRFDPLTSAFGIGLPISRPNLDRATIGFLHERMAEMEQETLNVTAEARVAIDDIIYDREDFDVMPEDEPTRVVAVMTELGAGDPEAAAIIWRYYMNRGARMSIERHWTSLSPSQKLATANSLPPWAQSALMFYVNGGRQLEMFAGETSGADFEVGPR